MYTNKPTLLIPVGGKSSRLARYGVNKALLPVKNQSIIFQIIEYWSEIIEQCVVVLTKENQYIQEYFINYYKGDTSIEFIIISKSKGTYETVKAGLEKISGPVILNWVDLLPTSQTIKQNFLSSSNLIVTSNNIACRWEIRDNNFKQNSNPILCENGILGIFLFESKNVLKNLQYDASDKEIEILESLDIGSFNWFNDNTVIDIGDEEKFDGLVYTEEDLLSRADGSQSRIIFHEAHIEKHHMSKKDLLLELSWYKIFRSDLITPRIDFEETEYLKMERIMNAESAYALLHKSHDLGILEKCINLVNTIHLVEKPIEINSTIDNELININKPTQRISRLRFLKNIVFNFEDTVLINQIPCTEPLELISRYKDRIMNLCECNIYHVIHGDPNLENFIGTDENLYLIDPRPVYGKSEFYGDKYYDYSKLYYGFVLDWSRFSMGKVSISIKPNNCSTEVLNPINIEQKKLKFFETLTTTLGYDVNQQKVELMAILILLSSVGYLGNNLKSATYAYLKGTELLNSFIQRTWQS